MRKKAEYDPVRVYVPASLVGTSDVERWTASEVVKQGYRHHKGDADGWCPMSAGYLRKHLSNDYRRVLDGLVRDQILEENPYYQYVTGERGTCRTYRFTARYRSEPVVPSAVSDRSLLRRIARYGTEERRSITDPVHLRLRDWHDKIRLAGAPSGENLLVDLMLDGERRFSVCEYGRVHTNVTSLPRRYRQYLSWNGTPSLSLVDVSSSQPLLLALLVGGKVRYEGGKQGKKGTTPHHLLQEMYHGMVGDTMKGLFYQRILTETTPVLSREIVKQETIALLYGRTSNNSPETVVVAAAFKRAYPGVLEWCRTWPHGELPRLMQKVESEVMIHGAAGNWLKLHPRVPVATIHDALMVPSEHADQAVDVIRSAWRTRWGVQPCVKCA